MQVRIYAATTPQEFQAGKQLILEYADFLGFSLEFQKFSHELDTLNTMYGAPHGSLLILEEEGNPVGVVGLRKLDEHTAEMKRMFVRDNHQGKHYGERLLSAFIEKAKALGYQRIRLDSIPDLTKALALYQKYGFTKILPYRFNPHPEAVFLEKTLSV